VPTGVGMNLGAVQRDRTHLEHPHLARQLQHLHEHTLDLLEKAPPKRRDRVVVGMVVRRDEPERDRIVGRPLQLPAGKHSRGVAVNQNAQQQRRMVGRRSRAPIASAHRRQVQPLNHFDNEPRQMPLRKPLIHRWWQKVSGRAINHAEIAQRRTIQRCREAESMHQFYLISLSVLSPTGC
jgi:hypothetical protein